MTNLSNEMARYESMLFDEKTTARTDYQITKFVHEKPTVYKEKPRCYKMRPPPLKDLHSMTPWKVSNVPFHLFIKPDPILNVDPNKIQSRYDEPVDVELETVRKTRPQVIMTPAVSLDNIKDDKLREMLSVDTYTSTVMYANREMNSRLKQYMPTKSPLPDRTASAHPIYIPCVKPPRVSPEWRMDSVPWEGKQQRGYVRPTKEFWLRRKVLNCEESEEAREQQKGKR